MKKPFDILLIEDSIADAEYLKIQFSKIPIINTVIHVTNNRDALEYIEEKHPNLGLVISDFFVNCEVDNIKVLEKCDSKNLPFIYLTGSDNKFTAVESFSQGALACLEKPIKINQLLAVIEGLNPLGVEIVTVKDLGELSVGT